MKSQRTEQYERAAGLAAHLADTLCHKEGKRQFFPPQIAQGAVELLRLADRLHKYNETACNYTLTLTQQKRANKLANRVLDLCNAWGIKVKFNGDPRGYAVKLLLPDGSYNTWGGKEEGWGI